MKRTAIAPVKKLKLVVIGNGPAGFKFCEKYVKYRLEKQYDLVVYGEERYPAYDRINLTRHFANRDAAQLILAPSAWYAQHKIVLKTGRQVVAIHRGEQLLTFRDGTLERYDKLILATGSAPFVPPIEHKELPGVFVYRTIDDLLAIQAYMRQGHRAVVIGGGILGLEAARALLEAGLQTTVVEIAPHLMCRQLDAEGAAMLQQQVERLGLTVYCNQKAIRVMGEQSVSGLTCKDGMVIPTDLVVISAGIRLRDELARSCGLATGENGGIVVNNYNLTADENIYAIGECALAAGRIWGLAAPCYEMAEVVAARLAKIYKVFSGNVLLTKLKVLETKVVSFGDALGHASHIPLVYSDEAAGIYKRVNITPDQQQVLGGILVGEAGSYARLFHMLRNKIRITGAPAALIAPHTTTAEEGVASFPDDTIICLCEGVCKGTIIAGIRDNQLTRLDEVKKCTNAGVGCESCTELLEEILANTLRTSLPTID
jgi:nitrite reductase (NADH) large subunit